jgi:hypothetical protein
MLEEKTRGNLDPNESRTLGEALTTLRLNFVEAANAGPVEADSAAVPPAAPPAASPAAEPPAVDAAPKVNVKKDDGEAPRFHKTYG